ncbi:MAG: M17 family peptidase N-terminal domain-containing protein, partial [Burkholderiaceae bacterium]
MDFSIKTFDAKNTIDGAKTGCIAVGVYENKKLTQAAQALDSKGAISAAIKSGDISGKPGSTLLLRALDGISAARILLVGLGNDETVSDKNFIQAAQATARAFATLGAADALIALPLAAIKERDVAWAIRCITLALRENAYRCDSQKSKKEA